MNKIFEKTTQFVFAKQKTIFSSAIILAGMIILSSFFGFIRYRILSGFFGKGDLDIFLASFKIPDLIFEVLITGALTSTFIPIYIKYKANKEELDENISSIMNLIFLVMLIFVFVLNFFLDQVMTLITPGYSVEKINKIVYFSRFLLLGQLPFLIVGNFLTGIGQANKTFLLTAAAPIIYNISIILATIFFAPAFGLLAPVVGVDVGAWLFLLVQLPLLFKSGFSYRLLIKKTQGLIEFFRQILPRTLTVIVSQIDATVDLTLTSLLGSGSYTVFYFAQHLALLPVSVVGVAFGQASLPYLSEVYQEKRIEDLKSIIVQSMLNLFFFSIPIAVFFAFARTPLIRLFFGGQKFDWSATVETAFTLSYFSLSLPFHTIYYFLTRCFYAFLDTRTPFFISASSVVLNTVLSILFVIILKFPVWALAISFSISMTINVLVLLFVLDRKLKGFNRLFISIEFLKMGISSLVPGFFVYHLMKFLDGLVFDTSRTLNVFLLLGTAWLVYISLYIFLTWLLDVKEIYLIGRLILKASEFRKKIVEMYTTYE